MAGKGQTIHKEKIWYRYWTVRKKRSNSRNKWENERRKDTTGFSLGIGPEAPTPNNKIRLSNGTEWNQIWQSIEAVTNVIYKKEKNTTYKRFFWQNNQIRKNPEDHWENVIELENECDFFEFSTKLLNSEFITSVSDRKSPRKLIKKDALKAVKQIQRHTYYREKTKMLQNRKHQKQQ